MYISFLICNFAAKLQIFFIMKAIIWRRGSTDRQEIESQDKELTELAISEGFKEEDLIHIGEAGASAIKQNDLYLQEVDKLISTLENDKTVKTVLVWEISRLARVELAFYKMKDYFLNNHIQLICKTPSLKLYDPNGKVNNGSELTLSLLVTLARQEMELKNERFHRARERNKAENKYNGGKIKLGYKLDDTKHFIVDEEKAKIVRDIFKWYVDGMSLKKIFERLVEMGIYKSLLNFNTGGKRVGILLKDRAYIGENFPPIVDEDTFNKAQDRMENRHKWHSSKNIFFCKGLIKDTATNATLCARSATLVYYVRHKVHCISLNINAMDFIALWSADLFLSHLNALQAENNVHTYDITIKENETLIEAKKRQIEEHTKTIQRSIEMNIAQPKYYPREKMEQTIRTNEKQIEAIQKQIVDLETDNQRMQNWMNGNRQFINTIYDYSDEKKFELIKDVIDRIEVTELEKHRFDIVVYSNSFINRQTIWQYSSQGHKLKIVQKEPINMDFTEKMLNNKRFERKRYDI